MVDTGRLRTTAVRAAVPADAAAVAQLHVDSFRAAYTALVPARSLARLDTTTRTRAWAHRFGGDGEILVSTSPSGLTGFVWIGPTTDVDDDPASVGQVRSIHVRPELTGQRIGQALLAAGRRRLREWGHALATLWVVTGNAAAQRAYARDGWVPDGTSRREPLGLPGEPLPEVSVERFRRRLTAGEDGS